MTRKQALDTIITYMKEQEKAYNAIQILEKISGELPFQSWNEELIRDIINSFYKDFGRLPSTTELDYNGFSYNLPSRSSIMHHNKMTVREYFNKFKAKTSITRKKTLQDTCKYIELSDIKNKDKLLNKLKEIEKALPFTKWDKEAVFDAFNQFYFENNRNATTADMKKSKKLPKHPTISNRFNMSAKAFLDKYYPTTKKCDSSIFFNKTDDEWLENFINQYKEIKPSTSEEYDLNRKNDTPSWQTIAKFYRLSRWNDFKALANVGTYTKDRRRIIKEMNYNITRSIDIQKDYINI